MSRELARAVRKHTGSDIASPAVEICPPPVPEDRRTAADAVIQACPPPLMGEPPAARVAGETAASSRLGLQIDLERGQRRRGEDSTGWLSSFTFHLLLFILLAMMLSPANFGGIDTKPIYLSFARDNVIEPAASLVAPELENQAAEDPLPEAEPEPVEALPDEAVDSTNDRPSESGRSRTEGLGASGGDSAAHGSFFGIEADGHEFVYILDMSGSMSGARYRRASDELLRSVEGLQESQRFYVLLFDSTTVQLFNDTSRRPIPLRATRDNKDRLASWLEHSFRGGNTDPRVALRLALRMNPSAIFMLSDGKFTKPRRRRADLLDSNMDAFSIVEDALSDVPIHAIAFEDPRSRENMKRLADMTQGEYRYIKSAGEAIAKQWLARGREQLRRGNRDAAADSMREIIKSYPAADAAAAAKRELAAILYAMADDDLKLGEIDFAIQCLAEMIAYDPQAQATDGCQQKLAEELLRQAGDHDNASEWSMLTDLVNRFPGSAVAQQIVAPLANAILAEARALAANDQREQAIQKLEPIIETYPGLSAVVECRLEQQRIIDKLLARAVLVRDKQGLAAAAIYLRRLLALNVARMNQLATTALEKLAAEGIAGVRDANRDRDLAAKRAWQSQLDRGFAGHETLQRMQRDMGRRELKARELLRRANRSVRGASLDSRMAAYRNIVDNYWGTIAAEKAARELEALQPTISQTEASWDLRNMVQP